MNIKRRCASVYLAATADFIPNPAPSEMTKKLRSIDYFVAVDYEMPSTDQHQFLEPRTLDAKSHPSQFKVGTKSVCLHRLTLANHQHIPRVRIANFEYFTLRGIQHTDAGRSRTNRPRNHKGKKLLLAFRLHCESTNRRSRAVPVTW